MINRILEFVFFKFVDLVGVVQNTFKTEIKDLCVGSGAAERVCGSERTREGCNHEFQ